MGKVPIPGDHRVLHAVFSFICGYLGNFLFNQISEQRKHSCTYTRLGSPLHTLVLWEMVQSVFLSFFTATGPDMSVLTYIDKVVQGQHLHTPTHSCSTDMPQPIPDRRGIQKERITMDSGSLKN